MTWTVSRNNYVSDATLNTNRARQTLVLLKDRLKAGTVPWTVVGSGTGTGGSFDMAGADLLPSFPSITGVNDLAWICLQNIDGLQIVLQVDSYKMNVYWSGNGGYDATSDADENSRPGNTTPPTKEVNMQAGGTSTQDVGQAGPHYKSVAVEDNGHGFIMFGKYSTYAGFHLSIMKTDGDPLDVDPYVCIHYMATGTSPWDINTLEGSSNTGTRQMYHPVAGQVVMCLVDFYSYNTDVFGADLQVNPYSNKTQLAGLFCWCPIVPNKFVRGAVPGFYRVPANKSMGDKFESGELLNLYNIAVPWGSDSDELL